MAAELGGRDALRRVRCVARSNNLDAQRRSGTCRAHAGSRNVCIRAVGPFFERNEVSIVGERAQQGRKRGTMVVSEERNKQNFRQSRLRNSREVLGEDANRRIINFESARRALEWAEVEKAHRPVALMDYSRLKESLSEDWLELLLTMALSLAALLGLCVGFLG